MNHLKVGETVAFDVINIPGYDLGDVNVSSDGIDVSNLFRVILDVSEVSTLILRGYRIGEDGRHISTYDLTEDGKLELAGALNSIRKFIVSGKLELKLEKEIFDEHLE